MSNLYSTGIKLPPNVSRREYDLFLEITGTTKEDLLHLSGHWLIEHHRLVQRFIAAAYSQAEAMGQGDNWEAVCLLVRSNPNLRR